MNYNDQILENKAFNFFKQLIYNIALAICIMLFVVLILVFGFKFRLYQVLSDSQAPVFYAGDMVVVKEQPSYKVGDIIKFDLNLPTTHRIIYIVDNGGTTYYICHGDNVQSLAGAENDSWQANAKVLEGKTYSEAVNIGGALIQSVQLNQIEGKVVAHISNFGTYVSYIKQHYLLMIALVIGIWCVSSAYGNYAEMRKNRRFA